MHGKAGGRLSQMKGREGKGAGGVQGTEGRGLCGVWEAVPVCVRVG